MKDQFKKYSENLKELQDNIDNNIENTLDRDLQAEDYDKFSKWPLDNGKHRLWIGVLYPDSPVHARIIETIPKNFPSAVWSHHDQDYNEDGKKLKDHIHYVIYFPNSVYKSHIISKYPDVDPKDIELRFHAATNVRKRTRYLLHYDDPDKYQYPIEYLEGNYEPYLKWFNGDKREIEDGKKLLDLLINNTPSSVTELMQMVFAYNLYSVYRRDSTTWRQILSEQIKEKDLSNSLYHN